MIAAAAALVSPASAKEVAVDYKPGQGLLFSAEGSEAEGRLSLWVQPLVGVAHVLPCPPGPLRPQQARGVWTLLPRALVAAAAEESSAAELARGSGGGGGGPKQ